ncbi:Leo1 protein [Starmerella bacillaris]|uniref:Leo1 protein n=1 Tax=Starmerella bacillaris TaxID=1247836 RepID=A0AAV5RGE7_STABA|nr:Leo1 protein [Starmerella bacillaris]
MSDSELFGDGSDMELDREPVHKEVVLKRSAPSHEVDSAWVARVPAFLKFERRPFDRSEAEKSLANKTSAESSLTADSIRWQYTRAEDGERVIQTSNAQIVEWSDGSKTLQVGNEHFEVRTHTQPGTFLCAEQNKLLQTRLLVDNTMSFVPTSTTSATHAMLAQALAKRQLSGQLKVGSVSTTEDPDKLQRDLEKAEMAREKARKKLAAQREQHDEPRTMQRRPNYESDSESNAEMDDEDVSDASRDEPEAVSTDNDDKESESDAGDAEEDTAARLRRIKERKVLDDSDSE